MRLQNPGKQRDLKKQRYSSGDQCFPMPMQVVWQRAFRTTVFFHGTPPVQLICNQMLTNRFMQHFQSFLL